MFPPFLCPIVIPQTRTYTRYGTGERCNVRLCGICLFTSQREIARRLREVASNVADRLIHTTSPPVSLVHYTFRNDGERVKSVLSLHNLNLLYYATVVKHKSHKIYSRLESRNIHCKESAFFRIAQHFLPHQIIYFNREIPSCRQVYKS